MGGGGVSTQWLTSISSHEIGSPCPAPSTEHRVVNFHTHNRHKRTDVYNEINRFVANVIKVFLVGVFVWLGFIIWNLPR